MDIEDNKYVNNCGKLKRSERDYKKTICDWSGALVDFVYHMEKAHPESFHRQKFREMEYSWTLDAEDKMEIAILVAKKNVYLYKVRFDSETKLVSHQLQPIQEPKSLLLVEVCDGFNAERRFIKMPCWIKHGEGNYRDIKWSIRFSNVLVD